MNTERDFIVCRGGSFKEAAENIRLRKERVVIFARSPIEAALKAMLRWTLKTEGLPAYFAVAEKAAVNAAEFSDSKPLRYTLHAVTHSALCQVCNPVGETRWLSGCETCHYCVFARMPGDMPNEPSDATQRIATRLNSTCFLWRTENKFLTRRAATHRHATQLNVSFFGAQTKRRAAGERTRRPRAANQKGDNHAPTAGSNP